MQNLHSFRRQLLPAAGRWPRALLVGSAGLLLTLSPLALPIASHAAEIVSLNATDRPTGPLDIWVNAGGIGDFTPSGDAIPQVVTVDGVNGVEFVGSADPLLGTQYVGPPSPITGGASRTVEAWVYNPTPQAEETVIAWGRRGGPAGSNLAFGHGSHLTFGAVGHWDAPDIGWSNRVAFGRWNHIAYTYDEGTRRVAVFSDGVLANSKTLATPLDTHATDTAGNPLPFWIQRQSEASGFASGVGIGSLVIAKVSVHDVALSDAEIQASFESDRAQFGLGDTDNDGMPDWFERRHSAFLDAEDAADAALDQDSDGLSNRSEFDRQTAIDDPDTDEDGLQDGVETGTGQWVSGTDTGTSPTNPDTDGDGLNDGVETNTGTFASATNTGTDPTDPDSDGDSYDDGGEVIAQSDPTDEASLPEVPSWTEAIAASAPRYWYRFEETDPAAQAENEGSAEGYDGVYGPEITAGDLGKPSVLPGLGSAIEFTGPPVGNTTGKNVDIGVNAEDPAEPWIPELTNFRPPAVEKATTVEYWIRTSHTGTAANQTWNSPAILARESGGDGDMYWGWLNQSGQLGFSTSDLVEIFASGVTDGQWHHVVLVKEWRLNELSRSVMYLDGGSAQGGMTIEATTPAGNASYQDTDGAIRYVGFTETGGGANVQFIGFLDELAIYDRALTETEARVHFRAVMEGDTDEDGMPDAYELANGLNPNVDDADLDADSDTLSNIEEFGRGTDPQRADSDSDGAPDNVETGTGVWVSANDRGSDPLDPDSDGDGLADGVETNTGTVVGSADTGTDPNNEDTDGDRFGDADEVALNTNPSDEASQPQVADDWVSAVQADAPRYFWRFEGASLDAGVPNDGSVDGFDGIYGSGIIAADLGKPSASTNLGAALEFTGPAAGSTTTKFVDFGAPIPELINPRTAPEDGKATTVEYWIRTTHAGTSANQTWNSPAILGRESPGDGDMYWGWFNQVGQFGFSTSDNVEIYADGLTDGQWHHVVMTKIWRETELSISRLFVDGGALSGGQTFEATTAPGAGSQQDDDAAIQFLGFTESGGSANLQYIGQVDEVAIYDKAFTEAQARLHYLAAGVAPSTFEILDISINPQNSQVTLTWEATAGLSYTVQRATSLPAGTWEAVGTVDATGNTATLTDTTPPPGAAAVFYRILQN
jgi:hypothetical protein